MNESGYKQAVNSQVKKLSAGEVYVWGIADKFTDGIPDTWYDYKDSLFIEYKYGERSYGLTPKQRKWLLDRSKNGRNVALVHGFTDRNEIYQFKDDDLALALSLTSKKEVASWILSQVKYPSGH